MGYQAKLIAIGTPKPWLEQTVNRLLHMSPNTPIDEKRGIVLQMGTFDDTRSAIAFTDIIADTRTEHAHQQIWPTTRQIATERIGGGDARKAVMRGFHGSDATLETLIDDCAELGQAGFTLYLV